MSKYPIYKRDQIFEQIPSMRSKFPTYEKYAKTPFKEFFSKEQIEDSYVRKATRFESSYIENLGDGKFSIKPLPARVQWSPIFGLEVRDVNGDQFLDVLAVGNSYAPDVITGRLDASVGTLLAGNGKGDLKSLSNQKSGFFIDGDEKGLISLLSENGNTIYIASQNNDSLKVFEHIDSDFKQIIEPDPSVSYMIFTYDEGSTEKRELYYGSGYLSQSTRKIRLTDNIKSVTYVNFQGEEEIVNK